MNCKDCYFFHDEYTWATTRDGREVRLSRCGLLLGRYVDRNDTCEFWNPRKDAKK